MMLLYNPKVLCIICPKPFVLRNILRVSAASHEETKNVGVQENLFWHQSPTASLRLTESTSPF